MSDSSWTPYEVDLLINLVRENRELYDQSCLGYSNVNIMNSLWREISRHFKNKDEHQLRKKWQILRTGYRSRRNFKQPLKRTWVYFNSLTFLEPFLTDRSTSATDIKTPAAVDNCGPTSPYFIDVGNFNCTSEASSFSSIVSDEENTEELSAMEEDKPEKYFSTEFEPAIPESKLGSISSSLKTEESGEQQKLNPVSESVPHLSTNNNPTSPKTSNELFLSSLLEDMEKLSPGKLRQFKIAMLNKLNELLE